MRVLSSFTDHAWASTQSAAGADQPTAAAAKEVAGKLAALFSEILLAENLIVMSGLGTSLCVKGPGGAILAPTMKALWDTVAAKAGPRLGPISDKVKYVVAQSGENIELLLSQCQLSQHIQPDAEIEQFIKDAEAIIIERCRFVSQDTDLGFHEAFLRKVVRRSTRMPRAKVFTSNYDLCFEIAAARTGFVVVDGFSHGEPQQFDGIHFTYDFVRREPGRDIPDYIANVVHLYKLHGSVDWEMRGGRVIRALSPARPLIIYPRDSKFEASYEQPFIEVMSRFQMAVRQSNTGLLVVGSGLNDRHLTEPIMSAVRSNVGLKAVFVSPNIEKSNNAFVKRIEQLVKDGDSRLILVAASFEELVPFLPDLVAATEEERHGMRLRKLDQ